MWKKFRQAGFFYKVMFTFFILFSILCTPIGLTHLWYSVAGVKYSWAFIFLGGFCPFFAWTTWVNISRSYETKRMKGKRVEL